MKTTIDIANGLLAQARARAQAEETTLRALIEDGLRRVLAEDRSPQGEPFEMGTWGEPGDPWDEEAVQAMLRQREPLPPPWREDGD
ncbi:MAG: hypothetical protein MSC31_06360 [Solirubrobacteraceae bacterium MAG38_C4-C5]|nr:hypothetical protein [Candidatus Siliceabacter maunaloa]